MRRRTTLALATTVVLCTSACVPKPYLIEVGGDLSKPTFRFGHEGRLKPRDRCLSLVRVSATDEVDTILWSAQTPHDDCRRIAAVSYGEAPDGFTGTVPAHALEPDTEYRVLALTDSRVGEAKIIFRGGHWQWVGE